MQDKNLYIMIMNKMIIIINFPLQNSTYKCVL